MRQSRFIVTRRIFPRDRERFHCQTTIVRQGSLYSKRRERCAIESVSLGLISRSHVERWYLDVGPVETVGNNQPEIAACE